MTSKPERLLDLVAELLHASRPVSADDLHERLPGYPEDKDSFKRAFERDKRDLREMGVPIRVETVPGTYPAEEGYRILPEEYYLPDPGLEPDELAAIHLAASAVRLEGGADAVEGLRKLGIGAVGAADEVRARLPGAPFLAQVFEAVGQKQRLEFGYRDKARVVDPARLQHQKGRWYLQGHDHDANELRSFRLDRIEGPMRSGPSGSATVIAEITPGALQLEGWAFGDDEPVVARVWIGRPQAHLAARALGAAASTEWQEDGSVILEFPVRGRDGFRSFVLGFLDDAEVLEPPELRADLVSWLQGIIEAAS